MKKSYLLLMCLLVVLTGFALPRVWNGPHPACGNPYDVRQRVDLTKFTPEQIQADAMCGQVKEFTARQGFAKAKQQTAETTTYFAVQQSMYAGYSFAYMNGEVLTWNVDVTIDGTTATISNLFNLDDPNDQYNSNTENDLVGTYDATAGTITIPTPTDFENATIAGSFYGTYPAVLSAGVVDATGTMTPESALVFNVSADLKTISTDMHYGVSMYMADGSMSFGFQEIFAKTLLTIPTEEANLVAFADAIDFGEVYPEYPITSSIKVVNAGNTAGDFVAACEGDGFTIEPTSGTIEPLAIQDLTITYNAPRANEEYEGIVTITHDGGDILLYLMGSCIDYPDYSALIKEGEMKLTTGMEYPFAVTDTMIDVPVGVSTIPGGTGGNVISYLEATFTVPEGKLGTFSWKGLCNSAVWYAAYGSLYVDGTWIQDWAGVTGADISGDYQFAPGEHKIRFQYNGVMFYGAATDKMYVYDLSLTHKDLVDYAASIDANTLDFGNFIYDQVAVTLTKQITLTNEGAQPLKVTGATNADYFKVTVTDTEVATLAKLPVDIVFSAECAGTFEESVVINTTAGDYTVNCKAFVREMPDFYQLVEEGADLITFTTNTEYPYIVENGIAYNSTAKVLDATYTESWMKAEFVIPDGKMGILSWDAELSAKSCYDENYNYMGGESGNVELMMPMNGYTWMEYGSNGGLYETSMSSEAMIAKSNEWSDYSVYTKFTPGNGSIKFIYKQGGDNDFMGEDRLAVKNIKLVLIDFVENAAQVDKEEVTFDAVYVGKKSKATITFTNMGSGQFEIYEIVATESFSGDAPTYGTSFNGKLNVTLYFNPTKAGMITEDLVIKTSAGDFTIKCSGEAISTEGILLLEDFEDKAANWLVIDADGDSKTWDLAYNLFGGYPQPYVHAGEECICSVSYDNMYSQELTPDNWSISPEFTIPATSKANVRLTYWVAEQLADKADHYSVYIIDEALPNIFDATLFDELYSETVDWTEWKQKEIDITDYAGKTCRIAFRHHDCTGQWLLKVDDIIIYEGTTAINEVNASREILNKEYYTIDGMQVNKPEKGIFIVKTTYNDGSINTEKIVLNRNK